MVVAVKAVVVSNNVFEEVSACNKVPKLKIPYSSNIGTYGCNGKSFNLL